MRVAVGPFRRSGGVAPDRDHQLGTGLGTQNLILEARNKAPAAQFEAEILGRAALERLAFDTAEKVRSAWTRWTTTRARSA